MAPAKDSRVDLGPTGIAVAENIRRTRLARGLSLRELAFALAENGHEIAHSGLSKIENKTRRVDVDDLVAISVALGVSPIALLLTQEADPRSEVEITGGWTEPAVTAWQWMLGTRFLGGIETSAESLPWWLRVEARYVLEDVHLEARQAEIEAHVGPEAEARHAAGARAAGADASAPGPLDGGFEIGPGLFSQALTESDADG